MTVTRPPDFSSYIRKAIEQGNCSQRMAMDWPKYNDPNCRLVETPEAAALRRDMKELVRQSARQQRERRIAELREQGREIDQALIASWPGRDAASHFLTDTPAELMRRIRWRNGSTGR